MSQVGRKHGLNNIKANVETNLRYNTNFQVIEKTEPYKNNTSGKRGRPPKLDRKVEEDLIAENQRLRMEIEYLKKLSALVLAEEQKNGKKRS
mgnify:CR=1 FL=1